MSERYDVVVAGGGTAGIAAALSSARLGARTLLVERGDALGGNATHALVHTFCGLYLPASESKHPVYANPGLPRRFAEGLASAGGASEPERAGKVWVLPVFPPVLEGYAASVCDRALNLDSWTGAELVGAALATGRENGAVQMNTGGGVTTARDGSDDIRTSNAVGSNDTRDGNDTASSNDGPGASALVVAHRGQHVEIDACVVVDATGDGAVGALAGAATMMASPAELQCASFIFRIGGVAGSVAEGFGRLKISVAAAGAVRFGDLPPGCESVMLRPGASPGEVYVTLNMPRLDDRPFDPLDLAYVDELERLGRARGQALLDYFRRTREEFRDAEILAWPRRVGIRETRRIRGRAVVSTRDVLTGNRRDDEVAVSSWPVELWNDHHRATFKDPSAPCSIPLGALVSDTHPLLGVAGRCVSSSHEALGALRVIGTALATGEAIGVAAAVAADQRRMLADITPSEVRTAIREIADTA